MKISIQCSQACQKFGNEMVNFFNSILKREVCSSADFNAIAPFSLPVTFPPVPLSDLQRSPSHTQTVYTSSLIREVDSPETMATTLLVDQTPQQLNHLFST